jgi:hypothetical protein
VEGDDKRAVVATRKKKHGNPSIDTPEATIGTIGSKAFRIVGKAIQCLLRS